MFIKMTTTFMAEGLTPHLNDQITQLQRKNQLLEGDKNAYLESSQTAIKTTRDTVIQLRQENKDLHKKLAKSLAGDEQVIREAFQSYGVERAAFSNMSGKAAQTVLDQKVCDKMKKLNALKHTTQTHRRHLDKLKLQNQNLMPASSGSQPHVQKPEEEDKKEGDSADQFPQKTLRILENRLEKAQLKCHEAEHIMRGYHKLKEHLQEESLTFHSQLDQLEADIQQQTQELKELKVMNSDPQLSRESAKAELQLQEEQVYRERREREKILSHYKRQAEEMKAHAERMERRPQRAPMHPDEMGSEAQRSATGVGEEEETMSEFEEAYQRIKDAIGVTDTQEIVHRFISQEESQKHLENMKAENERTLVQLNEEKNELQKHFQDMKYSGESKLSSEQQVLEECERHLQDEQKHLDAAKDRLEWLTRTLGSVRAGVQHLADKLQHMPLDPGPQLTPDSEEYVLQLLSDGEQKMMLLKEDLQGKDLATVMKEMEENEFQASMEEKLPQQNTRIQLPEAQKLDLFDDEKERGEDEGDVITRATLKHQSQLILDAKTKRRTRVKKSKDKR
ncbi:coiled-coil domain-containing protein 151 [Triplophysa rosa]|uniref:Coiled-coil domain-containing protein 151 n=1 Tax=Triplophysa rosa TaxID=992332 RepID=A0A9W8C4S3_TRIRA|nr:coiled-coil domain-containing protein 151 [Triplophysa rosa]KAI7807686.1 putative coiled-coil domain-containing protein 151 [Triplophysa rosa]